MRHRWHNSMLVLFIVMVVSVPATGWSKGDRPVHAARPESGVARGIVKASAQAILYAQVQGRVSQLPYREGQRFEKGHTLIQHDCDKYRTELAVATAEHEAKDKVYKK